MPSSEVPDGSVATSSEIGRHPASGVATSPTTVVDPAAGPHPNEHRIERLIERLPQAMRTPTRWLRRPSSRWVRIPAGGCCSAAAPSAFCRFSAYGCCRSA
jgi:hypothetical protein